MLLEYTFAMGAYFCYGGILPPFGHILLLWEHISAMGAYTFAMEAYF